MNTIDKAESSRRNGAKSHGPVSPEGLERSSRNSLKFGIYARRVRVLSTENQDEFDDLRKDYYQEWQPSDRRQCDLVEKIVDAEWRYIRFAAMEKWIVEDMMSSMKHEVSGMYAKEPDMDLRAALAYDRLYKQNPALENFQRERQRLSRIIDRFTRLLHDLQDQNPPAVSPTTAPRQNSENEPENPAAEPSDTPSDAPEKPQSCARAWCPPFSKRPIRTSEPPEVALAVGS